MPAKCQQQQVGSSVSGIRRAAERDKPPSAVISSVPVETWWLSRFVQSRTSGERIDPKVFDIDRVLRNNVNMHMSFCQVVQIES